MLGRTDLKIEHFEDKKDMPLREEKRQIGDFTLNELKSTDGKEIYLTLTLPSLMLHGGFFENAENLLANLISELVPKGDGNVLVAGLGNSNITADAIGPKTAAKIFATRHITSDLAKQINLSGIFSVAAIAPDVLGNTGIEAAEFIGSIAERIKPKALIVIDALCAANIERLGNTIQLTNTGISPGSGVKNARPEISQRTLKIPVISIGIPTVIDASYIFKEKARQDMVVTPKDIDLLIDRASTLLGNAINISLQPKIDAEILRALV